MSLQEEISRPAAEPARKRKWLRLDLHFNGADYFLTRRLFLRCLGCIYLVAMISYWVQVDGLSGARGIYPAEKFLEAVGREPGPEKYWYCPTLLWLHPTDGFLHVLCAAGVVLSALSLTGLAPPIIFFLLYAVYLSLLQAGGTFYHFQWDILLLETGFLAMFLAPWKIRPGAAREAPPSLLGVWLVRWLLFRLMFESGVVKLLWHDETWLNLTALNYHFESQPLPTWIGWYAHQLPEWFKKASVAAMYAIEIGVPFLIFCPRRLRLSAFFALAGFQVLILLTGNYCYFNALTIVLCIPLLDDRFLRRIGGRKPPPELAAQPSAGPSAAPRREPRAKSIVTWAFAAVVFMISDIQLVEVFHPHLGSSTPCVMFGEAVRDPYRVNRMLRLVRMVPQLASPLELVNSYGLFRVMTTTRNEIVVEGSDDGRSWREYEFKWKPGDTKRRPGFVAPHQPRLDWQMWFAALGSARQNPWFQGFLLGLLEGSPQVLALLEKNPFPDQPPRYVRALLYEYRFTDPAEREATGAWWRRELKGLYFRPASLQAR